MGLWTTRTVLQGGTGVKTTPINSNFEAIANILNGHIGTVNIEDLAVTGAKMAGGSVDGDKLALLAVADRHIAAAADIAGSKLLNESVMGTKIATNADIDGSKLLDNSIALAKMTALNISQVLVSDTSSESISMGNNAYVDAVATPAQFNHTASRNCKLLVLAYRKFTMGATGGHWNMRIYDASAGAVSGHSMSSIAAGGIGTLFCIGLITMTKGQVKTIKQQFAQSSGVTQNCTLMSGGIVAIELPA